MIFHLDRLWRAPRVALLAVAGYVATTGASAAGQLSFEAAARAAELPMKTATVFVNGASIYYRDVGSSDEVVVLLHGFPETGDAFAPVVAELGKRFRLIVPDLRGSGRSPPTPSGYDKRTLATDMRDLLDRIDIGRAHVVGYDLGARTAFSSALQFPGRVKSLTVASAFIEGLAGTEQMKRLAAGNPRTRHFAEFARVDESVSRYRGKEQELILAFMNSRTKARRFAADDVSLYVASLQRDAGLRAAFRYYEAFEADEAFVAQADKSALRDLPALAVGCEGEGDGLFRQLSAAGMQRVRRAVLKGCEHWVFEENPAETLAVLVAFPSERPTGSVGAPP
jgi:pimeloyl-ACP methyl ester carboxylesterase